MVCASGCRYSKKNCTPDDGCVKHPKLVEEPSNGIKLTAYSCICWLFHRVYYDARNHKHKNYMLYYADVTVCLYVCLSVCLFNENILF